MSDTKITTLPPMAHTFTVSIKGSETGEIKDGTFTYKRLTLGKRVEVAKMEAKLREEMTTLPGDVNTYVEMLAYLRYGLTEYPEWWSKSSFGLDLYDINIITTLYNECEKFETDWETKVKGQ